VSTSVEVHPQVKKVALAGLAVAVLLLIVVLFAPPGIEHAVAKYGAFLPIIVAIAIGVTVRRTKQQQTTRQPAHDAPSEGPGTPNS
jgi:membrane protein YdbS with pleckstrin-like domain